MQTCKLLRRFLGMAFMAGVAPLCFSVSSASAATYNLVDGKLIGAFDVDVGGTLYDVVFEQDSCINLYGRCDSATDFTFQTQSEAQTAADALLHQVFSNDDSYDLDPTLTKGCVASGGCQIYTPFAIFEPIADLVLVNAMVVANYPAGSSPDMTLQGIFRSEQRILEVGYLYATWTPTTVIPIPAAAWLFGSALVGFVGLGRRKKTIV